MNRTQFRQYRKNPPSDFTEIEIHGGCHAYFGMYAERNGDGTPSISAEEQIRMTAGYIADFVWKGGKDP